MGSSWIIEQDGMILTALRTEFTLAYWITRTDNDMYGHLNNSVYNLM